MNKGGSVDKLDLTILNFRDQFLIEFRKSMVMSEENSKFKEIISLETSLINFGELSSALPRLSPAFNYSSEMINTYLIIDQTLANGPVETFNCIKKEIENSFTSIFKKNNLVYSNSDLKEGFDIVPLVNPIVKDSEDVAWLLYEITYDSKPIVFALIFTLKFIGLKNAMCRKISA